MERATNTSEYGNLGLGDYELGRAYERSRNDDGASEFGGPPGREHNRYHGQAAMLDNPAERHVGQVRYPYKHREC